MWWNENHLGNGDWWVEINFIDYNNYLSSASPFIFYLLLRAFPHPLCCFRNLRFCMQNWSQNLIDYNNYPSKNLMRRSNHGRSSRFAWSITRRKSHITNVSSTVPKFLQSKPIWTKTLLYVQEAQLDKYRQKISVINVIVNMENTEATLISSNS